MNWGKEEKKVEVTGYVWSYSNLVEVGFFFSF